VREASKPIAEVKGVLSLPLDDLDGPEPAKKQTERATD
jgi:hypothetical protein